MKPRPLKRIAKTTRDRAINLRKNTTKPEQILWSILRGRQLDGLKFRRQHPIEPYVVDFYCAEASLIVELDGESHNGQEVYDKERSDYLMKLGLNIFRVTNDEVLANLDGVAEGIACVARLVQLKRRESLP
jgi:very-short-patch-repair endonuclease